MKFETFKANSSVKTTEMQSKSNKNAKWLIVEHTMRISNTEFSFTTKKVSDGMGKSIANMKFFKINGKGVCKRAFKEILETF